VLLDKKGVGAKNAHTRALPRLLQWSTTDQETDDGQSITVGDFDNKQQRGTIGARPKRRTTLVTDGRTANTEQLRLTRIEVRNPIAKARGL